VDEQVFADGIGAISMINGTVRVDLMAYSPTDLDAAGQPRPVFRQRVIMGLDAFLATAEKMHEAAQALAARNPRLDVTPLSASIPTPVPASPPTPTLVRTEPEPRTAPATPVKPPFP